MTMTAASPRVQVTGLKNGQNKYMSSAFKLMVKIKMLIQEPLLQEVQLRLVATGSHFHFFSFITSIVPGLFKNRFDLTGCTRAARVNAHTVKSV